jgi:transcriptional regulator with XRE-family HTH domain
MSVRGDRLRLLREQLGYSQAGLAERLNLGVRQIHRYENGISDPPSSILQRIAKELEVTSDYLLGPTDTPQPAIPEGSLSSDEAKILSAYRMGDIREALQLFTAGAETKDQPLIPRRKPAANG